MIMAQGKRRETWDMTAVLKQAIMAYNGLVKVDVPSVAELNPFREEEDYDDKVCTSFESLKALSEGQ